MGNTSKSVAVVAGVLLAAVTSAGPAWAPHNASSCKTIGGTSEGDTIPGTSGCDDIFAKGGADTVYAYAGEDDIQLDDGADLGYGGDGHDYMFGGPGYDRMHGTAGNDHIQDEYSLDGDKICPGGGFDFVDIRDSDHQDEVYTYVAGEDTVEKNDYDSKSSNSCPF